MRKPSLATQILAVNALLIATTAVAMMVAGSLDVTDAESGRSALVLVAAVLATILVNGFVLRRRFGPLERLIDVMERVDLSAPGARAEVPEADSSDVVRLMEAFNRMLARLEAERARTARAVLRAQEEERARLARDLHDECNQALTGVLLRLQATAQDAPPALKAELAETKELASQAMDELLRLARELRPAALDDHGLDAALRTQVDRFTQQTGIPATMSIAEGVRELGEDEQIVVYRVVQESLSNIARHADARSVRVELTRDRDQPVVRVADDGRGFNGEGRAAGSAGGLGLVGMRERARLAGGRVEVHSMQGRGTTVELRLDGAAR